MAETVDFASGDAAAWRAALTAYGCRLEALDKPDLVAVDSFYRHDLPALLHGRDPNPFIVKPELVRLLQWKLSRGKWRPRLMDFVKGLDGAVVESASRKAFAALPDEAMLAALGNAKEYTLKQYLAFADKLQAKAKELTVGEESFTPSDVERALWSSAIGSKSPASGNLKNESKTRGKRKR
ncbi:unnamed protein product [Urochloa humidicola]